MQWFELYEYIYMERFTANYMILFTNLLIGAYLFSTRLEYSSILIGTLMLLTLRSDVDAIKSPV